jgi:membrane-associated HD superfamily phosphohydrolase
MSGWTILVQRRRLGHDSSTLYLLLDISIISVIRCILFPSVQTCLRLRLQMRPPEFSVLLGETAQSTLLELVAVVFEKYYFIEFMFFLVLLSMIYWVFQHSNYCDSQCARRSSCSRSTAHIRASVANHSSGLLVACSALTLTQVFTFFYFIFFNHMSDVLYESQS